VVKHFRIGRTADHDVNPTWNVDVRTVRPERRKYSTGTPEGDANYLGKTSHADARTGVFKRSSSPLYPGKPSGIPAVLESRTGFRELCVASARLPKIEERA